MASNRLMVSKYVASFFFILKFQVYCPVSLSSNNNVYFHPLSANEIAPDALCMTAHVCFLHKFPILVQAQHTCFNYQEVSVYRFASFSGAVTCFL